jgi:protein-arginine kinase activator protein McsA
MDPEKKAEEVFVDSSTEDEVKFATLQGWTDQENYKGDPERYKTAKQFIDDGNKHATILKERNKKLVDQVSEMQSTMTQLVEDQNKQKEKAVKKAIDELKVQKAEAINESDGEKVNQIDEEIDQLKEEAKPEPKTNAEFDHWLTENKWYDTDLELKGEANMLAKAYIDAGSFKTMQEVYKAVTRKIKREFPDRFENPNKKEPSAMSEGSHTKTSSKAGKSYSDLPKDAKTACDRFIKTIPNFTAEKYLATYEWD